MAGGENKGHPDALRVGDPRRPAVGRAAFGTLAAAGVFLVFTVPAKQIKPLYDHAPWENDPFDAVYSFAMFFVPLIAALFLVQVSLCRKSQPLPVERALRILRGCRATVLTMAITLLSCWISVVVGANRTHWTAGATGFFVISLVLVTGLTGKVIFDLARAPQLGVPPRSAHAPSTDWLGDAIAAAECESHRLGRLSPALINVVSRLDRRIVRQLRHHPLRGAAITALLFGSAVGINQGLREGYALSAMLLTTSLLSCGTFAFLVTAGAYLGLVRSEAPLYGVRRRMLDAGVSACAAAVVSLAFRNSLWWLVGSNSTAAGTAQFAELIGIAGFVVFAVVLGVESGRGSHPERAADPRRN